VVNPSSEQRRVIDDTLADWEELPHVTGTVDPFATQAELDLSGVQLREGRAQLLDGQRKYARGARQLRQLTWLVDEGKREIARLRRTDPTNASLPARITGQAELAATLADGTTQLAAARARLDQAEGRYADAATVRGLGEGIRLVSQDGTTALVQVRFDASLQEISPDDLALVPQSGEQLAAAGIEAEYGQELVFETELGGIGEAIGVGVAAIVLLVMLGSLAMAGMPLAVAFGGVAVSLAGALALTHWLDLQQMAPVLGAMLGLAVGIDYALFIVNRHRRQLTDLETAGHHVGRDDIRHSIGLATGTAGTAVVVAGATVVIALAALLVSGIPLLMQMGLLAAVTVLVTVLVALTLTPALLSLVGRRAIPRRTPKARPRRDGWPEKWVGAVTRRGPLAVVAVVLIMGLLAIPALSLRLGLPDGGQESTDSTAYRAYERVEKAFGAGANGPILVSADFRDPLDRDEVMSQQARIASELAELDGVSDILPIGVSDDRRTIALQVVPIDGPSAEGTATLVENLRRVGNGQQPVDEQGWLDMAPVIPDHRSEIDLPEGVDIGVTGQTVANIEVSQRLADALPLYLTLVIGLSLLLLTIVFRSVLIPIIATAGFLLSVGASFGVIVAVYQWGWLGAVFGVHNPGAVMSFMPTLLIGILFGLAMDYQMFLVSGMRESYVHGETARRAVRSGFTSGARVVVAAALIMVAVFAGFVWSHMTTVRPIGLGLAVGVLLDAFLVRMTLTPAVMSMLGDRVWWIPVWLDRVLPHLDVEGSALINRNAVPADNAGDGQDSPSTKDGVLV
jgi:RND superfamily putative drug exporter